MPAKCVMCKKAIESGARKCVICSEYQTFWRRFLGMSGIVLALAVALVSVSTVLIPVAADAFRLDKESLTIRLLSFDSATREVRLFVSNTGSRPGAIRAVKLLPPVTLSAQDGAIQVDLRIDGERMIPGESSREFLLAAEDGPVPKRPGRLDETHMYTLSVECVGYDGESYFKVLHFDAVP